ncbi:Similar to Formin-binding protein 4; acc. no. Q8N3X1 [Pyronema omphalodes CBS 100304]|uniref:Similar to Formin-binding protein 4 acc. no. Q8N3X1 n=1 Tax=Pyronema omphalodes (strain CBS 100304) TaxID=1076935 RepID=U4LAD7_PYROM|nr:Similar to Formin-binding protein 4; acc. no. Q8N3X1 [Pyronema omphalodes CBS 100304]
MDTTVQNPIHQTQLPQQGISNPDAASVGQEQLAIQQNVPRYTDTRPPGSDLSSMGPEYHQSQQNYRLQNSQVMTSQTTNMQTVSTQQQVTTEHIQQLPQGWSAHWDQSQQRYYYHNRASGETTWEIPHVQVQLQQPVQPTPPPACEQKQNPQSHITHANTFPQAAQGYIIPQSSQDGSHEQLQRLMSPIQFNPNTLQGSQSPSQPMSPVSPGGISRPQSVMSPVSSLGTPAPVKRVPVPSSIAPAELYGDFHPIQQVSSPVQQKASTPGPTRSASGTPGSASGIHPYPQRTPSLPPQTPSNPNSTTPVSYNQLPTPRMNLKLSLILHLQPKLPHPAPNTKMCIHHKPSPRSPPQTTP